MIVILVEHVGAVVLDEDDLAALEDARGIEPLDLEDAFEPRIVVDARGPIDRQPVEPIRGHGHALLAAARERGADEYCGQSDPPTRARNLPLVVHR